MAMTGAGLATARKAAIDGCGGPAPGESAADFRTRVFEADSGAIVAYITTNARVTVNATVATPIPVQVTPATGTGGTTATGTASTADGRIA